MATKEKKLQISGITCASCATRIEKGLSKIDGVEKANVNLALETGTVVYDGEAVDSHAFKEKIEKLGYGVIEEKVEFDVVHEKLVEDFRLLDKAHKDLESELLSLTKSHENLQTQLTNIPSPSIFIPSSSTNILEENARLKGDLDNAAFQKETSPLMTS